MISEELFNEIWKMINQDQKKPIKISPKVLLDIESLIEKQIKNDRAKLKEAIKLLNKIQECYSASLGHNHFPFRNINLETSNKPVTEESLKFFS